MHTVNFQICFFILDNAKGFYVAHLSACDLPITAEIVCCLDLPAMSILTTKMEKQSQVRCLCPTSLPFLGKI